MTGTADCHVRGAQERPTLIPLLWTLCPLNHVLLGRPCQLASLILWVDFSQSSYPGRFLPHLLLGPFLTVIAA